MQFEPIYFIVAVVVSAGIGSILFFWQRPKLPVSYLITAVLGAVVAVYYILNVVFGSGRTGWP